jgi:hypothetical protein
MTADLPLDKNGQPYEPFSDAQIEAVRRRPYPVEVTRNTAVMERRREQIAAEGPRVYHAPEVRVAVETMAKAITRKTKRSRHK